MECYRAYQGGYEELRLAHTYAYICICICREGRITWGCMRIM